MLLKKLLRTAWNYKAQFLSMIIMIAIGIGVFLGFNIEWKSLEANTEQFFEETSYGDFRMYDEMGFSKEDIQAIKKLSGVDAATRFLSVNVSVKDTKKSVTLNVGENESVSKVYPVSGEKYQEDTEGIWLSDRFAEENGIALGEKMTFVYQGCEITGKVVGLVKSGENMICVADENQIMPDYTSHGFAYITPKMLERSLGSEFYPQINVRSHMEKEALEEAVKQVVGRTILIVDKSMHTAYAGAQSEVQEGKTMGSILPVLFLAIGILTMVTTMHRIAANEKIQIGTLKALGFNDQRILRHYTSYGLFIGLTGSALGIALGYGVAALVISPHGMMSTYIDLPEWKLVMPAFCVPVIALTIVFLTFISYLSVKQMLKGTAADALRPYTPKAMRKSAFEKLPGWKKLSFGTKWNLRDVFRHKARSAMTLLGVSGCMILLVGGLGMSDTMHQFLKMLGTDISNYKTKVNIAETADNETVAAFAKDVDGDWQASCGISYEGDTVTLDIYHVENEKIRFLNQKNQRVQLGDEGVYLCLRLKDKASIGDVIEISPYGSEETYRVKVAGFIRSLVTEGMVMSDAYAKEIGMPYHISSVYTDSKLEEIESSPVISGKQDKDTLMDSYDAFFEMMNLMIVVLIIAAVILGIVVLYNLGIMSYVERSRELGTLKVLGFRDRAIGKLLISQNLWLTVVGVLLGLLGGVGALYYLITALASEYEMSIYLGVLTYTVSVLLTFGVSLAVGWMVAGKNKKIDMVEALKGAE